MAYNSGEPQLVLEGYLFKSPDSSKASITKKWQQKWFKLLENGDLQYFDTEKSSKPGGTIPLVNCRRVFDPKSKVLQVNYCLGLEVGEATHFIRADTAALYNQWLDVIAAFAEKSDARHASSSPATSRSRTKGSEVKVQQGDSLASKSLTLSTMMKSAEKSGWLYKTGPNNKGWNHRYFVLCNGKLSYYKTEKLAEKSLGCISLRECTEVKQASVKKGYGLTVQVPNRTYHISADTEEDREAWITAISASLLDTTNKLSVTPDVQSVVRSGSGSSQSSITSRELFSSTTLGDTQTTAQLTGHDEGGLDLSRGLSLTEEDEGGGQGQKPERDSVVQLLEAEVDALRGQVSGLRDELKSSNAVTVQLQSQLQESVRQREREVHSITVERDNLHSKLSELESAKVSLESVNDSLRLQLDEVRDQGQDEEMRVRGELEEAQAALATAEEEIKVYQQELTDTQQLLQEIQTVAQNLQSELNRRDSLTPDAISKQRSLSTYAAEILSSMDSQVAGEKSAIRREEGDGGPADHLSPRPVARREGEGEGRGSGDRLAEERLKWLMEMENLRRECEQRQESERNRCAEEVRVLRGRVGVLEEKCRVMTGEVEEGRMAKTELNQARERVRVMAAELAVAVEKVTQLQAEKEKALADLNNIRKINRTIERKLNEVSNARDNHLEAKPVSPPAVEEGKLEEVTRQLDLVQKERDQLRTQLEGLMSTNRLPHLRGESVGELSPLSLRRKARATVAASNHSHAAPSTYTERSGSFSHVATSLANPHMLNEGAPLKPQRPSKAVINSKLIVANQDRGNSRHRTWGSNMFQNFFRGQS